MKSTTTKRGAPAGARAGAHDEGYEGRSSVHGVYAEPLTDATGPRRVAIYVDDDGETCELLLPMHVTPRNEVTHRRRQWRLLEVIIMRDGETIDQAIAREIAAVHELTDLAQRVLVPYSVGAMAAQAGAR